MINTEKSQYLQYHKNYLKRLSYYDAKNYPKEMHLCGSNKHDICRYKIYSSGL